MRLRVLSCACLLAGALPAAADVCAVSVVDTLTVGIFF
jgi:hypothetical protein